jgi:hypothetical protein
MNPGGLFVSSSGNVGINSINPTERLTVVGAGLFGGTGAGTYSLAISNNDQSNTRFRITNTGTEGQSFSIVGGNPGVSNSGLAIYDETNSTTRLYISSSGNVGIGTTSPSYTLDVSGSGRFNSGATAQNVIISSTNAGSTATTLQISNSTNSAFNDGVKMIQGGGVFKIQDLNSTNLLALDLTNTRVGIGTTSPGDIIDVRKNQNAVTYFYFRNTDTTNTNSRAYLELISGNNSLQVKSIHNDNCYLTPTLNTSALYLGVANSMMVTSGGNLAYNSSPNANYNIATDGAKLTIASGGTIDFQFFSGLIVVNNHSNGVCALWLVGAGGVSLIGQSAAGTTGTMSYNGGITGYTWTSGYGSTAFYGVFAVRTRANA